MQHRHTYTQRKIHAQTDRQTDGRTGRRQAGRQVGRQVGKQTDRQTDRQILSQAHLTVKGLVSGSKDGDVGNVGQSVLKPRPPGQFHEALDVHLIQQIGRISDCKVVCFFFKLADSNCVVCHVETFS